MARRWTLKAKILLSVITCFVLVCIPAFFLLFSHMNRLVYLESRETERSRALGAVENVNSSLSSLVEAVAWICGEDSVQEALSYSNLSEPGAMMAVLEAQGNVSVHMSASQVWSELNKIVIFSPDTGFYFECINNRSGNLHDISEIVSTDEFRSLSFPTGSIVRLFLTETINSPERTSVAAYGRVLNGNGYVYAEVSSEVFSPLFDNSNGNIYIVSSSFSYPEEIPASFADDDKWNMEKYELSIPDTTVVQFFDRSPLRLASSYGLAVFLGVLALSTVLFVIISAILSRYLTRTTYKLEKHIRYLTATRNYGYVDPDIEKGDAEIAAIGHTVNAMSISISELLKRNEALFEEKKHMEIDMLQMQVNPHFLYNTLESIYYLADIQKNDGVARMARGLSTLLRNMAKGLGDQIPLSAELGLLSDYDDIQQVRYMGMYELVYDVPEDLMDMKIQKFTLQPLVENAIFHGIEPSGKCGTITVSAAKDGNDLVVTVEDDGVGMNEEEISHIFEQKKHSKTDMTGVGVRNINDRIRLVYGRGYGLSFESEKGVYTKAIVRVRAERCTE